MLETEPPARRWILCQVVSFPFHPVPFWMFCRYRAWLLLGSSAHSRPYWSRWPRPWAPERQHGLQRFTKLQRSENTTKGKGKGKLNESDIDTGTSNGNGQTNGKRNGRENGRHRSNRKQHRKQAHGPCCRRSPKQTLQSCGTVGPRGYIGWRPGQCPSTISNGVLTPRPRPSHKRSAGKNITKWSNSSRMS